MTESQKQMILVLERAIQAVTQGKSPNGLILILAGPDGPMLLSCTPRETEDGSPHPMRDIRNKLQEVLDTCCYSRQMFDDGSAKLT